MLSGSGFWLLGVGLIVAGYGQWAWMPIAVGAHIFGYVDGVARGETANPTATEK